MRSVHQRLNRNLLFKLPAQEKGPFEEIPKAVTTIRRISEPPRNEMHPSTKRAI